MTSDDMWWQTKQTKQIGNSFQFQIPTIHHIGKKFIVMEMLLPYTLQVTLTQCCCFQIAAPQLLIFSINKVIIFFVNGDRSISVSRWFAPIHNSSFHFPWGGNKKNTLNSEHFDCFDNWQPNSQSSAVSKRLPDRFYISIWEKRLRHGQAKN